ncbi:MAG: hypothetical protein H7336_08555 [Bacteriovorax sp.]|nr:hypothetical protein [Bacteriovorax sp.]
MAKLQDSNILKNNKGQSVVEYILLLAVISSIGFTFYNNRKFKEFIGGKSGFFSELRKGTEYSYRYGRPFNAEVDYDEAMGFKYSSNKHDTYYNKKSGRSRFFAGIDEYGKK